MTVKAIFKQGFVLMHNVIEIKTFSDGAALFVEEKFTSKLGTWKLAIPRRIKTQRTFHRVERVEVQ